ncbi:sodium:solute symporter family protein [Arthrobacter bambusae]|uniref:SSS family solute:Na+ symporter n=1 Tax=Arthrobacter bambusae TaxID=1338426 RepID=A0AAW8DHK6_9MICC|nr:sodium:solute symporter family protein [Arthrobacter bambusae]MDP9906184.1 SSS family solute:Na+ symporter [Arthrobacter bambusae]MDQ0130583.1 SSS family solute:Na+ symporter [Arthrobacter bambusae]MDQ0182258.1 SSS family solute:Na+ symporter [Arthrobacter bambusae]
MVMAIGIILVIGSVAAGMLLASRGTKVDVQEWSVGGRRFGPWLFWFLLAGETFTASALLGSSQAIFSGGAPGYYVLGTVALAAPVGYFLVPRIGRAGKAHGLTTMGDYFSARFNARWFGGLITVFGIIALLLYTRVQLTGLSLILATLFGTAIPPIAYVFAGGLLVAVFVFAGGMRSAAFVAVVKDVLLVLMLLIVAAGAAHAAGVDGLGGIFDAVKKVHPESGTLPGIGGLASMNEWWWMSFLLLTPLGAFALPHAFQVSYTARNSATVRKNQIVQPLYSLFYVLITIIALAAILALPNLPAKQANGSLLIFVANNYPDWVVGLLAGCGVIVALVPTAVIMITASSMFTSNVLGEIKPTLKRSLVATRTSVVVFTLLAVLITAFNSDALLSIMTGVYSAVGQLAPALFLSFLWRRTTAAGLTTGAIAGGAIVSIPALGSALLTVFPPGMVVGVPALIINLLLAIIVSLLTKRPPATAIAVGIPETTVKTDADTSTPEPAAKPV